MEKDLSELVQKFLRQGHSVNAILQALAKQLDALEIAEPLIQAKEESHKAP